MDESDEKREDSSAKHLVTRSGGVENGSGSALENGMRSSLNIIVPVVSVLSVIPAALAWRYGASERGSITDSDFYQAIAGGTLQLLGLLTLIWPTLGHSRLSSVGWFWIWILAGFGAFCAPMSVFLYCFLSTNWSFVFAFAGSVSQAIVQLHVINEI